MLGGAGRAGIVVMLHPEDQDNAAEQKVAAITGIETLGGGAKVRDNAIHPPLCPPIPTLLCSLIHLYLYLKVTAKSPLPKTVKTVLEEVFVIISACVFTSQKNTQRLH